MDTLNKNQQLVIDNLGLARSAAYKFCKKNDDYEELFSVACVGLVIAANSFNPSKGFAFSTYATRIMYNEIISYLKESNKHADSISLNMDINSYDSDNSTELINILPCKKSNFLYDFFDSEDCIKIFTMALNILKPLHRTALLYSLAKLTQDFLSTKLHVTRSYVSLLYKQSKSKIRENFNNYIISNDNIYKVNFIDDIFIVNFSLQNFDISKQDFQKQVSDLMLRGEFINKDIILSDFKVTCVNDVISLMFPNDEGYFEILAEILLIAEGGIPIPKGGKKVKLIKIA